MSAIGLSGPPKRDNQAKHGGQSARPRGSRSLNGSGKARFSMCPAENPQNRLNELWSSNDSASLTSDKSYQIDSSIALNRAIGGKVGSPFGAQETTARA